MNKQTSRKAQERGVALVMALLMILVLGLLAATVMFTSQSQAWTGLNYRLTSQSRYAAEAGLQNTMNWLASASYTAPTVFASYDMTKNPVRYNGNPVVLAPTTGASNYPDSAVVTAYGTALSSSVASTSLAGVPNASYSTTATLLRMNPSGGVGWLTGGGVQQTWQITSTGTVGGVRTSTVQVLATYERTSTPVFGYGVEALGTGCGAINFNKSGDLTDSYNSSLGIYGGANVGSNGNVASNGNINLATGTTISGAVATNLAATVGSCAGGNGVTNGAGNPAVTPTHLSTALVAPLPWGCDPAAPPCVPPGTKITTAQDVSTSCASISGCTVGGLGRDGTGSATSITIVDGGSNTTAKVFTIAPGSYGNLKIDAADVVHVTAGTYTVNSLNFALDGQIVVDSGPVVFNMVGNCASGCPTESLPSGIPSTEVVYGAGFAGFNACSGGVTANPNQYTAALVAKMCGSAQTPFSGIPSNFQFIYGGTYTTRVGGMPNAMVSYAPLAAYYAPGAPVGLFGSIITKTFRDDSGSPFHYDTSTTNAAVKVGNYVPVGGFSWTKF